MRLVEFFHLSEQVDNPDVAALAQQIAQRYGIHLELRQGRDGTVDLEGIQVAKDAPPGTGTKAMEDLVRWADQNGVMLTLQFGEKGYEPVQGWKKTSSQARLKKFYARFGFRPNKGRYKRFDLSMYTSMYREPKQRVTESEQNVTGWINLKTGKSFESDDSHYTILRQHGPEMGIPHRIASDAYDSWHGPAQMAAYDNGWMRFLFWDGYDTLFTSGPVELMATPQARATVFKLVKRFNPDYVTLDIVSHNYGRVGRLSANFFAKNRTGMNQWFQKPFMHDDSPAAQQARAVGESRLDELVDVRTPQFKQWFGDSKVVNEYGQPEMVFHGTSKDHPFQEIQGTSHFGSLKAAHHFVNPMFAPRGDYIQAGQRIYPAYLKIVNPVMMVDSDRQHTAYTYIQDILAAGVTAGTSSLVDLEREWYEDAIEAGLTETDLDDGETWENEWTEEDRMFTLFYRLKQAGHDGIQYVNQAPEEDMGSTSWVIFDPSQVKYAYAEGRLDELYTPDVTYLKKYLQAGPEAEQLPTEFAMEHVDEFYDWLEEPGNEAYKATVEKIIPPGTYDDPSDALTENWWEIPDEIRMAFQKIYGEGWIEQAMQYDPLSVPSTAFYSGVQLLKRETWLVHFSDNAWDIASEGFKYGMDQMDKLGLTTYFKDTGFDKGHGGYNFAFEAGSRWASNAARAGKYGSDAIMFTNAGVRAWHSGDEEDQVMFWGANVDPRSIILITKEDYDGGWCVSQHPSKGRFERDCVYSNENFDTVTAWVERNWRQYAKIITGW